MAVELVLDASYALEAVLPSSLQKQLEAFRLLEAIGRRDVVAHVPWVFFVELAYVATKAARAQVPRLTTADAARFLGQMDALGLEVDAADQGSLTLHQAALRWHAGAYDAIYLDLAERLAAPLATHDRGVMAAARTFGVTVFQADAKRP